MHVLDGDGVLLRAHMALECVVDDGGVDLATGTEAIRCELLTVGGGKMGKCGPSLDLCGEG